MENSLRETLGILPAREAVPEDEKSGQNPLLQRGKEAQICQ